MDLMGDSIFYLHFLIIFFGPEFFPEYYSKNPEYHSKNPEYYSKIMKIHIRIFVPIQYVEGYAHEISVPLFLRKHIYKKKMLVLKCAMGYKAHQNKSGVFGCLKASCV